MKEIKLDYRKITIVLVIILIMLTTITTCVSNKLNRLEGQYEVLKEQYSVQKKTVSNLSLAREKEKDSLNFQISQREVQNDFLRQENNKLKGDIQNIKNRPKKAPKGLDNLTQYFNERHKTNENVVVGNKVGLGEYTAMEVVSELEDGYRALEIVPIQEEIIKNQGSEISNLEKDKVDLKTQVKSAEELIKEQKELNDLADKNIDNLNKQVKQHKRKNFWNKVLIVASGVGGVLIGNQLSK
jgi:peptidoglycan hydrolase CwlO-like protein